MSMSDYQCKFEGDTVTIGGVQFRNESVGHKWPIEAQCGDLFVLRIPSGKCWNGQGRPYRYIPAEMAIFRSDRRSSTCEHLMSVPLTKGKK